MAGTLALPAFHSVCLAGVYRIIFDSVSVCGFSWGPEPVVPALSLHLLAHVNTKRSSAYLFHDPRTWLHSVPSAPNLIHNQIKHLGYFFFYV